ncbi:hypothetical protein [Bacteroides acidifaciens]|uniref:hypothetical protein n=1 Tax=Bacteroides acidifaciens TaxID=85831 RepID=UPI0025A68F23|nr:hypothetical protein [Bacteroides acidifaciens]
MLPWKDINLLDFDDADRDVVSALMHRIQRMHSLGHHDYVRDDISQLTFYPHEHVSVTFNSHWNQKSEKELYQPIHNYFRDILNKGGNFGPQDEPFCSGEIFHRVTEAQMQEFVQTLTNATHQIADHIVENFSNNWAWKPDIYAYSFYTYEKFFDYTYHMVIDEECELDFEPDALYECPVLNLPLNVERRMYVKEDKLHDIVKDLLDFIEETDICNSNNVIWVRTILFNIGLAAFQTVCRTKELK